METLKEKTAKGLFWGAVNNGATQLLNIVIGIFLARLLSPGDYGLVGMLSIFSAIAGNLQSSGFSTAIVNMKSPTARDYNAVFWFNVLTSLAIYAVLFFSAPLIAAYFRQPCLVELSRLVFLSFVIASFGIAHNAYMFKNMMNRELAAIGVVALVVSGAAGIAMACCGMAYWSLAWQQIIYIAMVNIGRYRFTPWRPSLRVDFSPIRRMFPFSVKILVTTIVNTVSNNILTFIFGRLYKPSAVGNFSQAYKWNFMAYSFVSGTVAQVAQPVLAAIADDAGREKRVFRKMTRFTAFIAFPAMLGFSLVADEFITIAISSKWADSIPLMQTLCVGGAFMPLYTLFQNLAISRGRSGIYMWCNIAQIALQIAIIMAFHSHGIEAMVAAYTAFNILWLGVWHAAAGRLIGLRAAEFIADIGPFAIVAAAVVGVAWAVTLPVGNIVLRLLLKVAVTAALYFAAMRVARVQILQECIDFMVKKTRRK